MDTEQQTAPICACCKASIADQPTVFDDDLQGHVGQCCHRQLQIAAGSLRHAGIGPVTHNPEHEK